MGKTKLHLWMLLSKEKEAMFLCEEVQYCRQDSPESKFVAFEVKI